MFAGPTAAEFAVKAKAEGDLPRPVGQGRECEYCGYHNREPRYVSSRDLIPLYGVGCVIVEWRPICQECRDRYGNDDVFYCEECGHDHWTNTSWELHYATVDGEQYCLKCAAARHLQQPDFWVDDPEQVTMDWIFSRPHFPLELTELVSLDEDRPDGKVRGLTIDSMSGEEIYTDDGPGATVARLREMVALELREHERVGVVITRAYQFAVYAEVVAA